MTFKKAETNQNKGLNYASFSIYLTLCFICCCVEVCFNVCHLPRLTCTHYLTEKETLTQRFGRALEDCSESNLAFLSLEMAAPLNQRTTVFTPCQRIQILTMYEYVCVPQLWICGCVTDPALNCLQATTLHFLFILVAPLD